MKTVIQKISMLVLGLIVFATANAQVIQVSATLTNNPFGPQPIANGTTYDASLGGSANLANFMPVTITVTNTSSSSTNLVSLLPTLSGTGAADFVLNTTNYQGVLVAGASTSFTITLSSSATNGIKTVVISIGTNSISNATGGTYSGSITYNLANITTSIVKASDIGLSVFPNPSTDGNFKVTANNVDVDRIVVSNVHGVTQEFATKEFHTTLTGLLLVQMHTNKGVVSEKIIVE